MPKVSKTKSGLALAAGFCVLLLSGCVMPQSIRGTTSNPQQNFALVERNPQVYQGQEVRFGGLVESAVYDAKSNTTQLLLAVSPLDGLGQPDLNAHYQGIVLAYCAGFLNPEAYKGAAVTVIGPVIGYQDVERNQTTYRYIQVRVNGLKNWGQATMDNDTARQEVYDESQTFIAEEFNDSPAARGWHGERVVPQQRDLKRPLWINSSHPVAPPEHNGGWQHRGPNAHDGNWQHGTPPVQGGKTPHDNPGSRPTPREMPPMHITPVPHAMPQMHSNPAPHMHSAPPPYRPPTLKK
ncbi:Slp family lipoprotein [Serratia sp. M24T3]|uniref:Slp family lipoprotein n=1 Tax=Serratia sp. M24T3 TaxID=932213 RepID=UPI0002D65505|nr:Slp family lipoprotein [Serratia sp. M24T3]